MPEMTYAQAIDFALGQAMAEDPRIVIFGEDVVMLRRELYVRFGPRRVRNTPISEAAFLAMGVGAAMAGLRPVVEIMMVDFIAVALDALLNQATKVRAFSGGRWNVPLVIRASCGGGYGDGGQHMQCLWGLLSSMPGLWVAVPSNPQDAAALMLSCLRTEDPVIFMEHKLLSDYWRDYLGGESRGTVAFDVPERGRVGQVELPLQPLPPGKGVVMKEGGDLTMVSLGVGAHRCLEAAELLAARGIRAEVVDLRWAKPLDAELIASSVEKTGRLLVVDEDYTGYGLSGEVAALLAERGVKLAFGRVGTDGVIPYDIRRENQTLPNAERIKRAALALMEQQEGRAGGTVTR